MAQLIESKVTVKISKLVKDNEAVAELVTPETITNLEAVLEELINDPTALIEISIDDRGE